MSQSFHRPAFNVQLATATDSQVIVGVDADNVRDDNGHLAPMVEQIVERHGVAPRELLVDVVFTKDADLKKLASPPFNATVFAPVMASRGNKRDPHTPLPTDSPVIREWRLRMLTPAHSRGEGDLLVPLRRVRVRQRPRSQPRSHALSRPGESQSPSDRPLVRRGAQRDASARASPLAEHRRRQQSAPRRQLSPQTGQRIRSGPLSRSRGP